MTIRRLALAIAGAFLQADSIAMPLAVFLTVFASFALQLWRQPYAKMLDNRLEELSLATIAIDYLIGILMLAYKQTAKELKLLPNVLLVFNIAVAAVFVISYAVQHLRARHERKRVVLSVQNRS